MSPLPARPKRALVYLKPPEGSTPWEKGVTRTGNKMERATRTEPPSSVQKAAAAENRLQYMARTMATTMAGVMEAVKAP